MINPNFKIHRRHNDRRSGFNRRWIKSRYRGEERRDGKDRREGLPMKDLSVAEKPDSKKMVGFEKILISTTIQLEAITRLLLEKRIIKNEDLLKMMKTVQSEYQGNS